MKLNELLAHLTTAWELKISLPPTVRDVNVADVQLVTTIEAKAAHNVLNVLQTDTGPLNLSFNSLNLGEIGHRCDSGQAIDDNAILQLFREIGDSLHIKTAVQSRVSELAINAINDDFDTCIYQISETLDNPLVLFDLSGKNVSTIAADESMTTILESAFKGTQRESWLFEQRDLAGDDGLWTHLRRLTTATQSLPVMVAPVSDHERPLGYLAMVTVQTPLTAMQVIMLPMLADVLGQVMVKNHIKLAAASPQDELLKMLLTEQQRSLFPAQFAKQHVTLPNAMVLIRCEPESGQSATALKERLKYLMTPLFKQCLFTIFHHQCLALISIGLQAYNCDSFKNKLKKAAAQAGCRFIVLNYYTRPEDTIAANMVCTRTSKLRDHEETVVFFEDEFFDLVLARVHHIEILPFFINPALRALMVYDKQNHTELVKTLDVYLESTCNLTQTAKSLFVHPNTLRNRLTHITELTGIDVKNAETCFKLASSFKVRAFLEKNKYVIDKSIPTTDPESDEFRLSDLDL